MNGCSVDFVNFESKDPLDRGLSILARIIAEDIWAKELEKRRLQARKDNFNTDDSIDRPLI